jgi:predicted DNA-binding transcriptional regulator AlpA
MANPRSSKSIPAELTDFDKLPDSAHVRLRVVQGLYGCSPSAVWRNCKLGFIPAPIKLARNLACWNVGELRAALKNPRQEGQKNVTP